MNKDNQPTICKIDEDGNKWWTLNGQLHREDGPAAEWHDGDKAWYSSGQCHRIDGPAIERVNGEKSWWYHGKWINCASQEEFERLIKLKALW